MYQLYAQNRIKGWLTKPEYISNDVDDLELIAEEFTPKEYFEYMIIEHRKDGDIIVRRQELFQKCEVEYSDDVKVDFEVKATIFKPSKMKQKEELRKLTENYIDK